MTGRYGTGHRVTRVDINAQENIPGIRGVGLEGPCGQGGWDSKAFWEVGRGRDGGRDCGNSALVRLGKLL